MSYEFISPGGWYKIKLPDNWSEYDDESEGTCAFFNMVNWTGNLRITALRNDNIEQNPVDFITKEFGSDENVSLFYLGDLYCAHSKETLIEEDGEFIINYWSLGKENTLFMCSFTTDKSKDNTSELNKELEVVERILKSIELA